MDDSRADEQNRDRLTALSDGIFAIAMTLLVLDIRVTGGLDPAGFRHMVRALLPKIAAYALSFTILAGLWRDHRRILQLARRMDTVSVRLTLAGLGVIALLPFPTTLLSEYASQPLAVAGYAATIVVIDLLQLAILLRVWRDPQQPYAVPRSVGRTIVADLGSTVLVFGATVPIAFASPAAALWSWLALVPIRFALGRGAGARGGRAAG
ncbi:TMEM175 family protein [Streptomyces sp. NPDC092296]|uniref:TMEM175 family protein n=1 Tax=Streptomyces sp. NPDC092296 TaxID=3366012 RepID=UPI0038015118